MTITLRNPEKVGEARHGKKRGTPLYRYEVVVDGVLIGWVEQRETMTSLMHGNLRYRDFYPLRWGWLRASEGKGGLLNPSHYSRRSAVKGLLRFVERELR